MGWLYQHMEKGEASNYFKKNLNWENDKIKHTLLRGAFANFREYYGALEIEEKETGKKYVTAFVCMIDWAPKSYHNFGTKDMDESAGPNICNCPETILDMLSPVEDLPVSDRAKEWATNFRLACRENNLRRKNRKAKLRA